MSAGKGDSPRNLGPKFRENYDRIFGKAKGERLKAKGNPAPPKAIGKRTVPPHP